MVAEIASLAEAAVTEQLRAGDSADTKAGTVLGFDAVFAGLFFGTHVAFTWLVFVGSALLISVACGCVAVWPRNYSTWPTAEVLHGEYAGKSLGDLHRQLIAAISASQGQNDRVLAAKAGWFTASMVGMSVAVALGLIWFGHATLGK